MGRDLYNEVLGSITAVKQDLLEKARHKIDFKTKPPGSLGILEELALRMCLIQEDLNPAVAKKAMFVFAGDHGIAREGVSRYPQEVTSQMVLNFLNGGAAINVLCNQFNIDISIVDMGVNFDFEKAPGLIRKKVRKGTRDFCKEAAMTEEEAVSAIESGMSVFLDKYEKDTPDIIGLGEMGIGNTTSASAVISAATGLTAAEVTGRGTGVDDETLEHKVTVIHKALELHKPDASDGIDILKKVGGYEIAGIAGAVLAAAGKKRAVVLDGIISTAGGLVAYLLKPEIAGFLFSGHKSVEKGQQGALKMIGIKAIIDFNMRLGEGTGAAISMNIIDTACRIMREMASFEEAGVSH